MSWLRNKITQIGLAVLACLWAVSYFLQSRKFKKELSEANKQADDLKRIIEKTDKIKEEYESKKQNIDVTTRNHFE